MKMNIFFLMIIFLIMILLMGSYAVIAVEKNQSRGSDFFSSKTRIRDPFSLRDPFKKPQMTTAKESGSAGNNNDGFVVKEGVFTNMPSIEDVPIDDINIVGVLIGKERRALATVKNGGEPVVLKEGMLLGKDKIEIKAIMPGGLVLVEKIVNVYGQDEYLETILPITESKGNISMGVGDMGTNPGGAPSSGTLPGPQPAIPASAMTSLPAAGILPK